VLYLAENEKGSNLRFQRSHYGQISRSSWILLSGFVRLRSEMVARLCLAVHIKGKNHYCDYVTAFPVLLWENNPPALERSRTSRAVPQIVHERIV
jgi:hypothetical protein